jgi:hypothetical protein
VETDENGCFSRTKFSENMKFAAEDAVSVFLAHLMLDAR